jgi:histidinol-phosphate aminotransferase
MTHVPYVLPATNKARYKLDLNESPLPLPTAMTEYLSGSTTSRDLVTLYPVEDEVHQQLLTALAAVTQTTPRNIVVTAGSDEALRLLAEVCGGSGSRVFAFTPTYSYALQQFATSGYEVVTSEWREDAVGYLLGAIPAPDLIYLCSPNNPDGKLWTPEQVRQLVVGLPSTTVIVDEAYVEFGGVSIASEVPNYRNLVVTRTFSKAYGLAGVRIGYLIAHASRIDQLRFNYNPKAVTLLGKKLALCALTTAKSAYDEQIRTIMAARKHLRNHLRLLDSSHLRVLTEEPTGGNFLLLQSPAHLDLVENLLVHKSVAVRDRSEFVAQSFRVTIGDHDHMKYVFAALGQLLPPARHNVHLLVLAAGCGTRISSFWNRHKCLLPLTGGETILARISRQVRNSFGSRLAGVTVVTGYQADELESTHRADDPTVSYVYNSDFQGTNNWHSMLCGLNAIDTAVTVIAVDGDLVVSDDLVNRLALVAKHSLLVVDSTSLCEEEAMKARGVGDEVRELSKQVSSLELLGEFIGITVIAPQHRQVLVSELRATTDRSEYYEHAWTRSIARDNLTFRILDTWESPWREVDTQSDYEAALQVTRSATGK